MRHPEANLICNSEKQKDFPLKSGTREGYPFLPLLFTIVFCLNHFVLTRASKLERKK